jgi:apolipoprotein N-acyltransferase
VSSAAALWTRPAGWIGGLHPVLQMVLAAVAGAATGLGQAPWGLWPLTLAGLAGMLALFGALPGWKSAFWRGWAFGAGYFGLTLHWFVNLFYVDAAQDWWLAQFAVVLIASGMALFWGAAFGLARATGSSYWRLVVVWTGLEVLRSLILTGFPFVLIGQGWIGMPLGQMAAWIGPNGLTLVTFALAGIVVACGLRPWLLVLAGAVTGLGQVPWGLWPLTLAGLVLMLGLFPALAGWRAAFWRGWAFGAGYFGLTLHWIVNPFYVDAARDGWMAPFAVVLMASGMALFWGLAFAVARATGRSPWRLVVFWTVVEVLRSLILTGFPWVLVGHVWIGTPLAQMAAWIGPHGLTLFTLALAGAVVWCGARLWLAGPMVLLAAGWVVLDPGPAPVTAADAPVIRLVQPNMPQDQKFDPDMVPVFYERIMNLTGREGTPDLIVWPETALPWLLDQSGEVLLTASLRARGVPVVMGIQRREDGRYYNAMVLVDSAGQVAGQYDKHHLVPFGEYVPFGELAARFGIHGLAASEGGGYAAGPGPQMFHLPGIGAALPLICYEGIFAEEVNAMPERARVMLLITNDAWFGQLAGPYQHLAQGRLRAIEQGIPMVRVANTGVSALIDGKGRVLGSLPLGEAGALDIALPPAEAETIYARLGDWPVIVLLVVLSCLFVARRGPDSG